MHFSSGVWVFINTYSERDLFLLIMFSLCFQVVIMWLEKQFSDLQLLPLRLGRDRDLEGKSQLLKYIGYSENWSIANHKVVIVISVIWTITGKWFSWLMEVIICLVRNLSDNNILTLSCSFLCSWRQGSCWYKNYFYQIYNSKGRPVNSHRYNFCEFWIVMCIIASAFSLFA